MSFKTRVLAALSSLVLCISLAGCTLGRNYDSVATVDDVVITPGVYLYMQYSSYSEAYNLITDTSVNILSQKIGDQKVSEYIEEKTKEQLVTFAAIEKMFEERGLEFSAQDLADIETDTASVWGSYQSLWEENGIGQDSIRIIIANTYKATDVFNDIYAEGGSDEVAVEDLKDYFGEQYARMRFVKMSRSNAGSETMSDDDIAALKQYAQDAADKINDGADVEETLKEFAKQGQELREDEYVETTDYITKDFAPIVEDQQTYDAEMITALKELENGKAAIYEGAANIYVFVREDVHTDEADFEEKRETLLYAFKEDDFVELRKAKEAELTLEVDNSAIKYFSPKKVKYQSLYSY